MGTIYLTPPEAVADINRILFLMEYGNFAQVLEGEVKDGLQWAFYENFLNDSDPEGQPWQPRKPRKGDDGHPLLRDTLAMYMAACEDGPGAITRVESRSLDVGIDLDTIPYARAQNYGYPPNNLPAREFFRPSAHYITQIGETIADAIDEKIG